jgi:tetratricopeptide (TPR) repeat protein
MTNENLLPAEYKKTAPDYSDSLAVNKFYFTRLDSTIARYRITILKNDWPFSAPKTGSQIARLFNVADAIDSLALFVIDSKMNWEEAHRRAADYYLRERDYESYTLENLVLIDQYYYMDNYYRRSAETLLENQQYDLAMEILLEAYRKTPDGFSAKWIGIIELSKSRQKSAINYLSESLKYYPADPQILYNLAGAYSLNKEYQKALDTINKCLQTDPDFPGAADLKRQLEAAVR